MTLDADQKAFHRELFADSTYTITRPYVATLMQLTAQVPPRRRLGLEKGAEFMLVRTLQLDLAVKRIAHVVPPTHISPNPRLRASAAARSDALERL